MNLIDKIKKYLLKNKIETSDSYTTISLYDLDDVVLANIDELTEKQKELFLKYKKEINLYDTQSILNYNNNISKDGENLANLLIKILYGLNEIIRKDDKTEKDLQEIDINYSIKNMKIMVIRNLLYNLKNEGLLKTLAIQTKRIEYEQKEHTFIEYFSHAAKIKRNMELRNLMDAENRSKITVKTINYQINAINNAIISNNVYQNKMESFNKLISNNKEKIRRDIYCEKLEFYIKIKKILKCKLTKLFVITNLLINDLDKETEQKILENFAITEVELDKFIIQNKEEVISDYLQKFIKISNTEITCENKDKLLLEIKRLEIIAEVFKDYMKDTYNLNALYHLKFNILCFDINNQIESKTNFHSYLPRDDNNKEVKTYMKIVFDKINDINQGISPVAKMFQEKKLLKKVIKYLNAYFKSFDGEYRYMDILFNRDLLALLLSFDDNQSFYNFFKELKYSKYNQIVNDCVYLPFINFTWDKYLPLETIYVLYEVDGKDKPPFYDIYKIYHNIIDYKFCNYYLPEGIQSISNTKGYYKLAEDMLLINEIRKKSDNRTVVLPSTLKTIKGYIFADTKIRKIILNDGLEYIGQNVFFDLDLRRIEFPSSVRLIENSSFNFNIVEELVFKDFKNSQFLYFILYNDSTFIRHIFNFYYDEDYRKKLSIKIDKIVLQDKEDGNVEITKKELYDALSLHYIDDVIKLRKNLAYLIEEKTGIELRKYHEEKQKQY